MASFWTKSLAFALVAPALPVPHAGAETARGVVYHDRNGNQIRDDDESPIEGVGVSNGRDIVTTDGEGRYELFVDEDTILFVLKPAGWRTPVDDARLPRFYYVHKPNGSPSLAFGGVDPTGPLPESVDFPLQPQEEPERFHAILFGDPQTRDEKEIDYLARDVVEELIGSDAAFGVTLGDMLFDDLSLFARLNATIAAVGIPWYNVIGNHDINFDAPNDRLSDETFESVYGPTYYSFDYGPVHFLVLDDVFWEGPLEDSKRYPGANYTGGLGPDQLAFVERDLARIPEERLVVLLMHVPLVAAWMEEEREALYRLVEKRPYAMSISAHYHYHEHVFLTREDGWRGPEPHHHVIAVTTSGSWWSGAPDEAGIPHTTMRDGAPNGYAIVRFDRTGYVLDFKAARRPADEQMRIHAPESVARGALGEGVEVFVNVYNGSERSAVELRVGGRPPVTLDRVERADPHYEALVELEKRHPRPPGRKLPRPMRSPHLWRGVLPDDLPPGTYDLRVRTIDMWGRTFEGRSAVRVLP